MLRVVRVRFVVFVRAPLGYRGRAVFQRWSSWRDRKSRVGTASDWCGYRGQGMWGRGGRGGAEGRRISRNELRLRVRDACGMWTPGWGVFEPVSDNKVTCYAMGSIVGSVSDLVALARSGRHIPYILPSSCISTVYTLSLSSSVRRDQHVRMHCRGLFETCSRRYLSESVCRYFHETEPGELEKHRKGVSGWQNGVGGTPPALRRVAMRTSDSR